MDGVDALKLIFDAQKREVEELVGVRFKGMERPNAGTDPDPDPTICARINDLVQGIQTFARETFTSGTAQELDDQDVFLDLLLQPEHKQLVRYITCLSMAGKGGEQAWVEFFKDESCCRAVVAGIVGRALKEHVFNDLFFGASDAQRARLEETEWEDAANNNDGKCLIYVYCNSI